MNRLSELKTLQLSDLKVTDPLIIIVAGWLQRTHISLSY